MTHGQSHIVVCALYKFVTLERFQDLRQPLLKVMEYNNIRGTLLLASEGINGTVAGHRKGIDVLLAWFEKDARLVIWSSKSLLKSVIRSIARK